jgi:hypothetical protein
VGKVGQEKTGRAVCYLRSHGFYNTENSQSKTGLLTMSRVFTSLAAVAVCFFLFSSGGARTAEEPLARIAVVSKSN